MSFEKEIKVLDINVADAEQKLHDMGAELVSKVKQKIYTYDLPTISHRLQEIADSLRNNTALLVVAAYKQKLKTLLLEAEDLLSDEIILSVKNEYQIKQLPDVVDKIENINEFLKSPVIGSIIKLDINPNKWVRLRESGGKTTLTVKHVFDKNDSDIQKVGEYEIIVNDVDEANRLLIALGFAKRNVQEKVRTQYKYKNAEIDIDEWPRLKPYMEIESDDESVYQEIIDKCGYQDKKVVSCNTEELYRQIGVNIKETPELLF